MKLSIEQRSAEAPAVLGGEAGRLLCKGDFAALAVMFGYAVAFGREPAIAMREALESSLAEVGASACGPAPSTPPSVSFFKPKDSGQFALVAQHIPADNGGWIRLDLVVSIEGEALHLHLEQISAVQ
jgi:hypothetical protein